MKKKSASAVVVEPVVELPLSALRPWAENPRTIRPARLDDLIASMRAEPALRWAKPVWVDSEGMIFAGNQRYLAAREIGLETLPVQRVHGLTRVQMKTWALLDNNTFGDWDQSALADFLSDVLGEGVDAVLTGFETRELDAILATITPANDPDEIPAVPAIADSRSGEIYALGQNTLLCGDSTDAAELSRLLNGEQVSR